MNIGQKINILFERSGYKNYADWGKAMGLPSDWLLDLKKKDTIKTIDITRLIVIADYNQITLDELLKDNGNYIVDMMTDLPDNDIYKLLNQIQIKLQKTEVKFNGYIMNKNGKDVAYDAIDVLKGLIRSNL
ncbi:MAG: hypothetical protein WC123_07090 [Bacilli bacterium]